MVFTFLVSVAEINPAPPVGNPPLLPPRNPHLWSSRRLGTHNGAMTGALHGLTISATL